MGRRNLLLEDATHIVVDEMLYYSVAFVDSSRMLLTQPYPKYVRHDRGQRLLSALRIPPRNYEVLFGSITAVTLHSGGMEVETETHTYRIFRFFEYGDSRRRQDQVFNLIRLLDFVPESEGSFRFVSRAGVLDSAPVVDIARPRNRRADAVLRRAGSKGIDLSRAMAQLGIDPPQPRLTLTFGRAPQLSIGQREFLDFARFRNERLGKYTNIVRANGLPAPAQDAVLPSVQDAT